VSPLGGFDNSLPSLERGNPARSPALSSVSQPGSWLEKPLLCVHENCILISSYSSLTMKTSPSTQMSFVSTSPNTDSSFQLGLFLRDEGAQIKRVFSASCTCPQDQRATEIWRLRGLLTPLGRGAQGQGMGFQRSWWQGLIPNYMTFEGMEWGESGFVGIDPLPVLCWLSSYESPRSAAGVPVGCW
jgi:hypothetical protein